MTTVQKRRARARGGELDECLRACAAHSGKVVGSVDRRRVELGEQLRKLLVVWGTTATTTPATPAPSGATALLKRAVKGPRAPPRVFRPSCWTPCWPSPTRHWSAATTTS